MFRVLLLLVTSDPSMYLIDLYLSENAFVIFPRTLPTKQQLITGQQLASKAVALGDAKTLRKYLEASLDGNSRVLAGVVDGKTSW